MSQQILTLRHESLKDQDLSRRTLEAFTPVGCTFERCNFGFWEVKSMYFGAGLSPSNYRDCIFDGSKFSVSAVGSARFERCSFMNVDIKGLMCNAAEFVDCTFSGVLRGASFGGTLAEDRRHALHRNNNQFAGNDFSQMDLRDVTFVGGIDLTLQRLPQGDNYVVVRNAQATLSQVRESVQSWPDPQARESAFAIMRTLEVIARTGQTDVFVTKDSFIRGRNREVAERVFVLLGDEGS